MKRTINYSPLCRRRKRHKTEIRWSIPSSSSAFAGCPENHRTALSLYGKEIELTFANHNKCETPINCIAIILSSPLSSLSMMLLLCSQYLFYNRSRRARSNIREETGDRARAPVKQSWINIMFSRGGCRALDFCKRRKAARTAESPRTRRRRRSRRLRR